jgi:hypothetical protein
LVVIGIGVDPLEVLLNPMSRSLSDDSGFTVISDTEDEEVLIGIATGVVLLPAILIPDWEEVDWEVGRGASGLEDRGNGEVESEREARESRECCVLSGKT